MDDGIGVVMLGRGHDDSRDIRMFDYFLIFAGSELSAYLLSQFFRAVLIDVGYRQKLKRRVMRDQIRPQSPDSARTYNTHT